MTELAQTYGVGTACDNAPAEPRYADTPGDVPEQKRNDVLYNVVLVEPEIPQNTGNIARTCACLGARLHLVEPMGFRPTERNLQRSGCDYWDKVDIVRWTCAEKFFAMCEKERAPLFLFTGHTARLYTAVDYPRGAFLVFGRESTGLDEKWLTLFSDKTVRIPMREGLRSLNLANSVAIGLCEAFRQQQFEGLV